MIFFSLYFTYILNMCPEKPTKVAKAGKIPRYQGLQQKNKQLLKPVTPSKFFVLSHTYTHKNNPVRMPFSSTIYHNVLKYFLNVSFSDFKKLHEAHFNKMESIDSYVQRKTRQMDTYRNSVKELKVLRSFKQS